MSKDVLQANASAERMAQDFMKAHEKLRDYFTIKQFMTATQSQRQAAENTISLLTSFGIIEAQVATVKAKNPKKAKNNEGATVIVYKFRLDKYWRTEYLLALKTSFSNQLESIDKLYNELMSRADDPSTEAAANATEPLIRIGYRPEIGPILYLNEEMYKRMRQYDEDMAKVHPNPEIAEKIQASSDKMWHEEYMRVFNLEFEAEKKSLLNRVSQWFLERGVIGMHEFMELTGDPRESLQEGNFKSVVNKSKIEEVDIVKTTETTMYIVPKEEGESDASAMANDAYSSMINEDTDAQAEDNRPE